MPNNYLSVLNKHIIQVENKNVGLKVGGHKHTIAPPPPPNQKSGGGTCPPCPPASYASVTNLVVRQPTTIFMLGLVLESEDLGFF